MKNLHETWSTLRHGGNLLSPQALEKFPPPISSSDRLEERLRAVLVQFSAEEKMSSALLGEMLDLILETACGLTFGWLKGSAIGSGEGVKLLDGKTLKPRRLLRNNQNTLLAVFTSEHPLIGHRTGRRIVAQVIEYLRRTRSPLALLTNGRQWRLIWADIDSLAWVEWDAERWLHGDKLSDDFHLLRRILSMATLFPQGQASSNLLLLSIQETRKGQAKLSKELGERVRRSVEALLRSRQPILACAWHEHQKYDLYVASSHFVMRLVVILFAEARELLPVDNPVYYKTYSLQGLLEQLDRLSAERQRQQNFAWPRLLALFRLLHQGSPHPAIILPAYGGDLFRAGNPQGDGVQRALALLESLDTPPTDDVIYQILILLTRTKQKIQEGSNSRIVAAPVDFTELTSEYIGILYEGLLDYELHKAGEHPIVFLNLGDQPALALDRLETMDEKTLKGLVEQVKVKKQSSSQEDEEAEQDDDTEDNTDDDDEEAALADEDDERDPPSSTDDDSPDDLRHQARIRAEAWAYRAIEVAKLVKKPKGKHAQPLDTYQEQVKAAATQLIADLKLPGELYLVRWGGTRKGSGTFYTRPQLTLPTVRRTLEPLLYDENKQIRPPEDLLALKICDPAMGSGSFLVAALRILTAAVIESLHTHQRLQPQYSFTRITCDLFPEKDRAVETRHLEERLEAIVRRVVVDYCLYGVDLDPLAVELARVGLWVETLDSKLPFTFLDHKLRCGNALVGTWLDRFRDYPLLAFDRQSPDYKRDGVHFSANQWHDALKAKRNAAITEQAEILTHQLDLFKEIPSDKEIQEAFEHVQAQYQKLRAVPAARPDERASIWREQIQNNAFLQKIRQAFDTWCALWFWPLDLLDLMPLPQNFYKLDDPAQSIVTQLQQQKRFFHWELEYPDVFTEEHAGFDAIVGNPPWEIQKPNSKEFFSNHDPLFRSYGKQEALRIQKSLFEIYPAIEAQWLAYLGDFKDRGNFVKHAAEPFGDAKAAKHSGGDISLKGGATSTRLHTAWRENRSHYRGLCDPKHPFRHQGSADLNTYKMFVEFGHALLRKGGQLGLIVPGGIYTDKGTTALRQLFLEHGRWRWLYGFENRNKLFDIDSRFKFCILIAEKGGKTESISVAFMRHNLEDWGEGKGVLQYPAERIASFSPKSLSILEIRSREDLDILTKIYNNGVLLGDESPDGWGIKYAREFDMTTDSKLFIPRDKAEANGYKPDEYGRWINDDGEVLLPLYEGRMIGQFDFSEKGWVSGKGRSAVWRDIPWEEKKMEPQYLMNQKKAFEQKMHRGPKIAYMRVGSSTNSRTVIATYLRELPAGDSVFYFLPINGSYKTCFMIIGQFGTYSYDWALRLRVGGLNLSEFLMIETSIISKLPKSVEQIVLSLACCSLQFADEWWKFTQTKQVAWKKLWAITPHERLRLRCMLDAMVAVLYGLDRADFAWILKDCDHPRMSLADKAFCRNLDPKGFWRVDKDKDPELRHPVLSLVAFDDLQAQIQAHNGDREVGIKAFCEQNDGDGWMLPEQLCLRDLGLTRSVAINEYHERACVPQPVRSVMGERFLDWQLAQTPEESWAECERHAKILSASFGLEDEQEEVTAQNPVVGAKNAVSDQSSAYSEKHDETPPIWTDPVGNPLQKDLFGNPLQTDLFGNMIQPTNKRRK
jgi:hypothetical protein